MTATEVLRLKAVVRERDGYACTKCGMSNAAHIFEYGRQLEVHRLSPGSPYAIDTTTTLCKKCHASEPKRRRGSADHGRGFALLRFRARGRLPALLDRVQQSLGLDQQQLIERVLEYALPHYEARLGRFQKAAYFRPAPKRMEFDLSGFH